MPYVLDWMIGDICRWWAYMTLGLRGDFIEWLEIYVVDENIWFLDGEVRDGLVMLDLLMCIKVIRVYMNVGLELMWCLLISLCIVEW